MSDTKVDEPEIRARLGTAAHFCEVVVLILRTAPIGREALQGGAAPYVRTMFRVQGSGFRVQGSGFRVQGSGFRVQGAGFGVQGSGFRVGWHRMHVRRHLKVDLGAP